MDFDSPSRRRDAAVAVDCCGAALCRIAVCCVPFLLYDYVRCSFFALISLICLCWRRHVDAVVVVALPSLLMACNMLPSFAVASLALSLSPHSLRPLSLSQNDFKQVRIRVAVAVAVVVVVQVHSKSDYVCLCTCVCVLRCASACARACVCVCESAFAYAKYLVLQRRRQQKRRVAQHQPKNRRQSHMLHLPLIY